MTIADSIILGIIQGVTEFLPVSSTGHLILASKLLGIEQDNFQKSFEIVILFGACLATFFLYLEKVLHEKTLWLKLLVAFLPTGILGFLFYKHIKALFVPSTVAYMLIIGGVIFIIIEFFYKASEKHINNFREISYKQAFLIGVAQSFSMIPGTSRSGSTIIGGLLVGLNRKTAVEFSFMLSVPTIMIATLFDVYKHYNEFTFDHWQLMFTGFVVAFLTAIVAIKTFLKIITKYNFVPFGIYRILIGVSFLYFMS